MKVRKEMDCKACRREIEWVAGGEDVRSAEARTHLSSCPDCRRFRAERRALSELLASVEPVVAPLDFDWKLRARLAAEKSAASNRRFRLGLAPGIPAIAMAALFVLLIAAAVYLKQARPESLNTTPVVATVDAPAPQAFVTQDKNLAGSSRSDEGRGHLVATAKAQKPVAVRRQRAEVSAQVKSSGPGAESATLAVASAPDRTVRSNDFSSSGAPVITLLPVPVRTPTQPVRVLLDEGSGTLRTVALQPVTFGSQEILRRSGASSADDAGRLDRSAEDIW
jgi:hypothetical protein